MSRLRDTIILGLGLLLSCLLTAAMGSWVGFQAKQQNILVANAHQITSKNTITLDHSASLVAIVGVLPPLNFQSTPARQLGSAQAAAPTTVDLASRQSGTFGTGFVLDGLIVTNKHVVPADPQHYVVVDNQENQYQIEQILRSPDQDIAILQVANLSLPTLILATDLDNLVLGSPVTVIGSNPKDFSHVGTAGTLTGKNRRVQATKGLGGETVLLENLLTTEVPINPGSSGGVVLDAQGRVIGLNVATSLNQTQQTNFAIAFPQVRDAVATLKAQLEASPSAILTVSP